MSGVVDVDWSEADDEERLDRLSGHEEAFLQRTARRLAHRLVPEPSQIIDVRPLSPRQRRAFKFVGSCIGIPIVYAIAGCWWGCRGVRWAIGKLFERVAEARPKEVW
jgi:hypothetical protein